MPQTFTVGSNRYLARSFSLGRSYLKRAAIISSNVDLGSNVLERVRVRARSFFVGGRTRSQIPSIAGRWSFPMSVPRAWTSRHTGDVTHTAFELWISWVM